MKPRISLVTLGVSDLERARRFYVDGLGLPVRPESQGDVIFLDLQGTWLVLWPAEELAKDAGVDVEGSGFRRFGFAHNVDSKEAVDALVAQAQAAGATVPMPPHDTFWGGYAGYFADPDGFLWEVAWNPFMPDLL